MAASRHVFDPGQYLLSFGMKQELLQHGYLVTVHSVESNEVVVRQMNGSLMTIHFDLALPTPAMEAMKRRWLKTMRTAFAMLSTVRLLGIQHIQGTNWRATETTVMLKQNGLVEANEIKLIEAYAGGMGGWSRACGFLNHLSPQHPIRTAAALEINPNIAQAWNQNAGVLHSVECAVGDATSIDDWIDTCADSDPNALTLSSPCTSFSLGGACAGWDSKEGSCLASSLWIAHQSGIQLVMLENVGALKTKTEYWDTLCAIIEFCGYQVASEGNISPETMHPVIRNREIMVLVDKNIDLDQSPKAITLKVSMSTNGVGLWQTKRWMNPPESHLTECTLPTEVLDEYLKDSRMPHSMRSQLMVKSKVESQHARCIKSHHPLSSGTLMAAYSKQHRFDGLIYGSLRKVDHANCRLLHPFEQLVACGISMPVILEKGREFQHHIVGNSITEFHALVGLVEAVNAIAGVMTWSTLDLSRVLESHVECCMTNRNTAWIMTPEHEAIMFKSEAMGENGLPIIRVNQAIDVHQPPFTQEFVGGRYCKITEMHQGVLQTPYETKIQFDTTPEQIIDAMKQCNPTWEPRQVFGTDGRELQARECFEDKSVVVSGHDVQHMFDTFGILLGWSDFMCWLPLQPHEFLKEWRINGIPFSTIQWHDADGEVWDPDQPVLFNGRLQTEGLFNGILTQLDNHALVVRIEYPHISSQFVKYEDDQVVEDLLYAEQVLMGPKQKITDPRDRQASPLNIRAPLAEVEVVVCRIENSHDRVEVQLRRGSNLSIGWFCRGTRIFQMCDRAPREIPIDATGKELPWDLPIYAPMTIDLIASPDEEISSTEAFSVHEDPDHKTNQELAFGTSVQQMVDNATENIRKAMERAVSPNLPIPYPFATQERSSLLMKYGPAVGDDEMLMTIRNMPTAPHTNNLGVWCWDSEFATWSHHPLWKEPRPLDATRSNLMMLLCDNHWIPAILDSTNKKLMYQNTSELPAVQLLSLTALLKDGDEYEFDQHDMEQARFGWCGLDGIKWLQTQLNLPDFEVPPDVDRSWQILQSITTQSEYGQYTQAFPMDEHAKYPSRLWFLQTVTQDPTWPTVHGFGAKEQSGRSQQQLKTMGRIAAVLIAKGHSSGEATQTAERLMDVSEAQLKAVNNDKDNVAYMRILESCIRHDIAIQRITKSQAVAKLQNFWRSKWSQKKPNPPAMSLDPRQIRWLPKSFMVRNGQYVEPKDSWGPISKGLTLATKKELEPYLAKDKILTTEVNTALSCEPITAGVNIKVDAVQVSVEDNHGNLALIQAWLTHFGQTPVVVAPTKNAEVAVEDFSTISITVYKQHVEDSWWNQMTQHPVRFVLQQMFADEIPKFSRVWSRRWCIGTKICDPTMADSFSFLGSLLTANMVDALRRSGTTKPPIFVSIHTPKGDANGPKWGGYRVIWMGKALDQTLTAMSTLDGHCGLVFKQPSSYGVRVKDDDFAEAWKEIRSDTPPTQIQCKYRYSLDNVPSSVDPTRLEEWSKSVGWPMKVLKRHNTGKYVVGVADHPKENQYSINSTTILHRLIHESKSDQRPILAGRLVMNNSGVLPNEEGDFMQREDPWMQGRSVMETKPQGMQATGWERYTPTSQVPTSARSGAHQSTAASDENLKLHATRMTAIEADLQAMKTQMMTSQKAVESRFGRLETEVTTMQTSLKASLEKALNDQSAQLIKNFEQLMKSSPRTATPKHDSNKASPRSRSPTHTRAGPH
eukprot:Skav231186  [mRNA]  locus=scaffold425:125105:130273:+ [translate_table: standard]